MTNNSPDVPEAPDPFKKPARSLDRTRAPTQPPTDQGWWQPDRVFIDLELPHLEVTRSLDVADDARIWEQYRRSHDPEAYLESLAVHAGTRSLTRQHSHDPSRTVQRHQTLVASAFLLAPEQWPVATPTQTADREVAAAMLRQLQSWVGYQKQQEVSVIMTSIPYKEVCRWSPVTQREQLACLDKAPPPPCPAPWLGELAVIPQEFPALWFFVGRVQHWQPFPELPEPGRTGQQDWDLRSNLAGHLAYVHQRPVMAHEVLRPAVFANAVRDGLRMWLDEIARRKLVFGWQVHTGCDDLVLLELTPVDGGLPAVMVPIRRHQVGSSGVDLLMTDLQQQYGAPLQTGIPAD